MGELLLMTKVLGEEGSTTETNSSRVIQHEGYLPREYHLGRSSDSYRFPRDPVRFPLASTSPRRANCPRDFRRACIFQLLRLSTTSERGQRFSKLLIEFFFDRKIRAIRFARYDQSKLLLLSQSFFRYSASNLYYLQHDGIFISFRTTAVEPALEGPGQLRATAACLRPMTLRPHEDAMRCNAMQRGPGASGRACGPVGVRGDPGDPPRSPARPIAHTASRNLQTRTNGKNTPSRKTLLRWIPDDGFTYPVSPSYAHPVGLKSLTMPKAGRW